jgi:hypothetical protein
MNRAWRSWAAAFVSVLVLSAASAGEPQPVRYPHFFDEDERNTYVLDVLKLALAQAGGRYVAVSGAQQMQQGRALKVLAEGSGIEVVWTMTSVERERELRPIRFPLDRGLYGWRVLLIHESQQAPFAALADPAALRAKIAGQGHDWPDTAILRANGFQVTVSSDYGSLFRMLQHRRIDYFPRAVVEVGQELAKAGAREIVLDQRWLLHYPTAVYFFVRKDNTALAQALEQGLERALADGSFAQLFDNHFGPMLTRLGLAGRQIIELDNPLLPEPTPLARPELWYRPVNGRR